MININNKDYRWEENLTIESLLIKYKDDRHVLPFVGCGIIVVVNEEIIRSNKYEKKFINDRDRIKIIPLIGGG